MATSVRHGDTSLGKIELDTSPTYLRDNCLVIKCEVTIFMETMETSAQVKMPPSEKLVQLSKIFETKKGANLAPVEPY